MQTQESSSPQSDQQNLSHKQLKAMTKASRPWYLKKRFWLLGIVGVIVIAAMAGGGGSKDDDNTNAAQPGAVTNDKVTDATGSSAALFPGRVDAQKEDKERNIGQGVEISGYTATVNSLGFQQSISSIEKDGYVMADVTVLNRDDRAQSYNLYDWKLQTTSGQVLDPTFTSTDQLGSGDLVKGGTVTGQVPFKVGAEKGDFYLIYKPDPFDSARGIWKVTR